MPVWTQFLEQNPDHALAFFSRARLHLELSAFPEAIADLKKACALGLALACAKAREY